MHRDAGALERQRERIGQGGLGGDALEVNTEVNDGQRNLRTNTADEALGAHQAYRRHCLELMLSDHRIDGRHTGDIDEGDLGTGLDDAL